ncbi:helicase associated domain-containing protein [Streptomyces sp. NPDC002926]
MQRPGERDCSCSAHPETPDCSAGSLPAGTPTRKIRLAARPGSRPGLSQHLRRPARALRLLVARSPAPSDGSPSDGFPLGTWIAEQRRYRRAGRLTTERVKELDAFAVVWSQFEAAFEE